MVLFEILDLKCFRILAWLAFGLFRTNKIRLRLNRSEYLSGRLGCALEVPSLRNRSSLRVSRTSDQALKLLCNLRRSFALLCLPNNLPSYIW
jgi:hypothetical protein